MFAKLIPLVLTAIPQTNVYQAAEDDWNLLLNDARYRYLIMPEGATDIDIEPTLRFVIASTTLNPDLTTTLPVGVAPGVWRIDLKALGWTDQAWIRLGERHPYSANTNALMVRADWLIEEITDGRNEAYFDLLFGGKVPTTVDEFIQGLGVQTEAAKALRLDLARVEGRSGVAKQRIRRLRFFPTLGGYYSRTDDFEEIRRETSPLEQLLPDAPADAHELIVSLRKTWVGGYGNLQAYALADGANKLVGNAPVSIVEDHSKTLGLAEIVNFRGCVSCHINGLIPPNENLLADIIGAGVSLEANDAINSSDLTRLYLSSTDKIVTRANEDYQETIKAITGLETTEFVEVFRATLARYHQDVSIEDAAAELLLSPAEFEELIGQASKERQIGAHVAAIVAGLDVPRPVWEDVFLQLRELKK